MQIPNTWPQPDPGGGWRLGYAWWKELPAAWVKRFQAEGLPIDWYEARRLRAADRRY